MVVAVSSVILRRLIVNNHSNSHINKTGSKRTIIDGIVVTAVEVGGEMVSI
jgi:hypothetical protein